MEISKTLIRMWDTPPGGELYSFEPDADSRIHEPMTEMPHLDEIHRHLAEHYAANRGNLIGVHLEPAVKAIETAIAARDGSSVYFAAAGERIKIGWSRRVSGRLAQLQTGSAEPIRLLGTVAGGRALERRLHDQFDHLRLSGEWFSAAPELLNHVAHVCQPAIR